MKKIVTQIVSLLILSSFLVSFTGVRLMVHKCDTCGTVDVALFQNGSESGCCDSDSNSDQHCDFTITQPVNSCCSTATPVSAQTSTCCSSETLYLKAELEIFKENGKIRVEPLLSAVYFSLLSVLDSSYLNSTDNKPYLQDFSPPLRSGREFVIFTHQLKIS